MALRSKYRNKKTKIGELTFDSKKEARYYEYLKLLQSQGKIHGLEMQVRFKFPINGVNLRYVDSNREITYVADFVYFNSEGQRVVCDVKGFKTDVYKFKKAMMLAVNGILIEEV